MLYWLSLFSDQVNVLNLFRYLTVRTGGAMVTAGVFVFLCGPWIIDHLRLKQGKGQPIRTDGPQSHLVTKKGTPTMGGLMILLAACYFLGSLGREPFASSLTFPFFKDLVLPLGWFFVGFGAFIIVGAGNAVNLTDGLDGLAIGPVMIAAGCFGVFSYVVGNAFFTEYLQLNYVPGTGELTILCGAVIGAGLGFLWFNAPPASIFMGDTGSLALGGMIGTIAVATKHEIVLAVVGGLFVLEAVSVIVQVVSFKLTGKRVFRMAPIHHHFEQLGWTEPQIVIRFWIVSV